MSVFPGLFLLLSQRCSSIFQIRNFFQVWSNGLVSSHTKCLIFQEVQETSGSLSFLPNRQVHSTSALACTPSAALKLRREIKRKSWDALILCSNAWTLKLSDPWPLEYTPEYFLDGDDFLPVRFFTASRSPVVSHCCNLQGEN